MPGGSLTGTIAWASDEDVYCVPERSPGKIRWKVRDGLRDTGVLQVIPLRSAEPGAPVRLHLGSSGKASSADVLNPWISPTLARENDVLRCIRVAIEKDPWAGDRAGAVPSGGNEAYTVEVEAVP